VEGLFLKVLVWCHRTTTKEGPRNFKVEELVPEKLYVLVAEATVRLRSLRAT